MITPHFQVGIVVPDLQAAMAEIGASHGVTWSGPVERDLGRWILSVSFARTPPPYIELIEALPGSVWSAEGGAHIHHLGYWSEDMDADSARLEALGMEREYELGYVRYHRSVASGARVELVDVAGRDEFDARWQLPT